MIIYKKALLSDVAQMQQLMKPEVESGIILSRSNDEIATNIRSYILAFNEDILIGFTALHIHSSILGEIRSLIVAPRYQSQKIGTTLVQKAVEEATNLHLKQILALTYKKTFFEKLGFIEIPKESLPDHKIWADCINCKHFPICNEVSLIKTI